MDTYLLAGVTAFEVYGVKPKSPGLSSGDAACRHYQSVLCGERSNPPGKGAYGGGCRDPVPASLKAVRIRSRAQGWEQGKSSELWKGTERKAA